jgi:FkbH-like protein
MLGTFFNGRIFATLITNVAAAILLIGPMLLAATGVAGLLFLIGAGPRWPWFAWVIAGPIVYLSWIILYLGICAVGVRHLGRRHPKPRHYVMRPGESLSAEGLGIRTAMWCYGNFHAVERLPFARETGRVPWLSKLWLRSYAPTLHVGSDVINMGFIVDPDLTEVGDKSVLGGTSVLAAHALVAREDGALVFSSAPIKIGRRVTLGGQVWVSLGSTIGDDAVLEPRTVAGPFTQIPPGEVWGGNPARFLRKRNATEIPRLAPEAASIAPVSREAENFALAASPGTASSSIPALRELVIDALQLVPDEVPAELSRDTCAEWDSLGQVAIAAALFDRYGIVIEGEDVFRIRSLHEIADLITRTKPAPAHSVELNHGVAQGKVASGPDFGADADPLFPDDVEMLPLLDPQQATAALSARLDRRPDGAKDLRVCIAASFTVQPVAPTLKVWGRAFGLEIECCFAEYDQIVQALLDPDGPFAANRAGVNIVLTRLEDLVQHTAGVATNRMDDLLDAVRSYAGGPAARGQLLVGTLPPVVSAYSEVSERVAGALRERWSSALEQISGVEVFNFAGILEQLGTERARSSQNEVLARAPYSPQLYQTLAITLVRSILATRRAPAKVIALDCDNTLWGGIVGEVGLDGIQLGPDGPGHSFQLFQWQLKGLQARGFLLVIASRNEPHDVREVFEKHPEMILRPDDIAAWRVNWEPKSQNIRELADELRLGVDSFVFLDDDPVARMEVKSLVPGVHVVPLPTDPSHYCETLGRLWLFDGPPPSAVDASRTRMMHEESRREEELESFRSLDEFLVTLQLSVEIGSPSESEWARVAQLTQRTNQFSLSLKRRTLEELRSVAADQTVMVLKAQDRFGEYGLVGTCILMAPDPSRVCEIDTLLMSCRALGRGVEDAFLHQIGTAAARQGSKTLVARYIAGPRNAQIRAFLTRHRFTEVEPDVFSIRLEELSPLPAHIRLVEREVREDGVTSFRAFTNADDAMAMEHR